jgi:Tfp pilus assembly protein PilX
MKSQGFIFILTLCITTVMSLLVLSGMQHVLLYQRAASKQEKLHQRFYQLEHTARGIIGATEHTWANCMYLQNSANQVIQELIKKNGCSLRLGDSKYRYMIEDLGTYPCLVNYAQETPKATHHFRLTVLGYFSEEEGVSAVQIRVVKRSSALLFCDRKVSMVNTGISSWRFLSRLDS